jgi:hypothetical protein
MTATAVTPNPVRAEELVLPLATFEQGDFTIFLPSALAPVAALGAILNPKVHIFFAAAGVQGDVADDVLVHGLRSASNNSDWILIAVRGIPGGARAISDADILTCLSSVGVNAAPAMLRLSAHSRGCDSLVASLQPGKITTLAIIDRVVFLDEAVEHAGSGSPTPGVITLNRVAVLRQRGIPAARMVSYEVGNRSVDLSTGASAHVPGATYFELPPNGMAAIGCVRLIGDGVVRNPALGGAIAANQALTNQITAMLMPARGNFSVMVPGGQDLKQWCQDHTAAISQIVAKLANPQASLLKVVNDNDLARFGGFRFSWGIAAHHFFVAEIAHELTS